MFTINGYIKCSDIDYNTNSFYVHHNFGKARSASKTFAYENGNVSEAFRPSSVVFRDGCIKVSIGTYRFPSDGIIRYSFNALSLDKIKIIGSSPELYFNMTIISTSRIFAKITVRGILPGDVVVQSDVSFMVLQHNRNPLFFWDTPCKNADVSNSFSENYVGVDISGYYYAFNKMENYVVKTTDKYTSNNFIKEYFETSGTKFFHIRAVNTAGNLSRNTSTVMLIYNNPPSIPTDLKVNFLDYYIGHYNKNLFSWRESSNSDSDLIRYEIEIFKDNDYYKGGSISSYRCKNSFLYGNMRIYKQEEKFKNLYCSMNIVLVDGMVPNLLYGVLYGHLVVERESRTRTEDKIYYLFEKNPFIAKKGMYSYRIRGYDWAEQSKWSDYCYFDTVGVDKYISSKMWIGHRPDYRPILYNKMFVNGDARFFGNIYIIPDLYGRLIICSRSIDYSLEFNIKFKYFETLYGKLYVDRNFLDIYGSLYIYCKPGKVDLTGKMRFVIPYDEIFYGSVIIRDCDYSCVYGDMFVFANGSSCISGSVLLIRELLHCKMNIIRNYYNDKDSSFYRGTVIGSMSVLNFPPVPEVTSDVGHDWTNNRIVNFSWTIPKTNIQVTKYGYYISKRKITDFSNVNFLTTSINSVQINLDAQDGDGVYYFYVYSVSNHNETSEKAEYIVRYNNLPSTPDSNMFVNEQECIEGIPIVSRRENNIFSWRKSSHLDDDIVKYNIQISKNIGFTDIIVDKYDIIDNENDSTVEVGITKEYSSDTNVFYWRVRSYDVNQYTQFGYTGRFRCNTKPGIPTNLSVENEV